MHPASRRAIVCISGDQRDLGLAGLEGPVHGVDGDRDALGERQLRVAAEVDTGGGLRPVQPVRMSGAGLLLYVVQVTAGRPVRPGRRRQRGPR